MSDSAAVAPVGPLPARRVKFEYPEDLDPAWNPRLPEFAFAANSLSLLMPFVEPYIVASTRAVLDDLPDPLRATARDYMAQESGHHAQHRRFNRLIAARYGGIAVLERWMARSYGWLGRRRGTAFNAAFAAASETVAFSLARWTEHHLDELFVDADPVVTTLFLWHLAEEVEHKEVAFDVYREIGGSHVRYAAAMGVSLVLLAWFTVVSCLTMLVASRRIFYPVAWYRLVKYSISLAWTVLPDAAVSLLPSHHPRQFTDPVFLSTWLRYVDPETGTMPLWSGRPT